MRAKERGCRARLSFIEPSTDLKEGGAAGDLLFGGARFVAPLCSSSRAHLGAVPVWGTSYQSDAHRAQGGRGTGDRLLLTPLILIEVTESFAVGT